MSTKGFSRSEALRFGWQTLKRNLGLAVGVGVAGAIASMLMSGLGQATERAPALATGFALAGQVVQAFVGIVWFRLALLLHDGRAVALRDLLPDWMTFLSYLAVSILYGLLVAAGLVLLVVPGIYLAVRYGLVGFLVVDERADVLGSFRRSSELTRGVRWSLFVLGIALLGINLLGALAFGVGLLFTIPLTAFAAARAYRQLEQRASEHVSPITLGEPTPA